MKYGMLYDNKSRHLYDFNEVIIKYKHKTGKLIKHIKKYKQEQRIIIDIQALKEENVLNSKDIFLAAADEHPNIAIMGDLFQYEDMREIGLPFFFPMIIDSWDKLNSCIDMGVSDVYIGNEFAFSLKDIALVCHKNDVSIRVFANVAQTKASGFCLKDTVTQFFIRPEDVKIYEDYVDIIEFFGTLDRQDVLYDIYTREKWLGNLKDIIIGLEENVNNTLIADNFGKIRSTCKKRCSYSSACNICKRFISISNTLEEAYNEHKNNEASM